VLFDRHSLYFRSGDIRLRGLGSFIGEGPGIHRQLLFHFLDFGHGIGNKDIGLLKIVPRTALLEVFRYIFFAEIGIHRPGIGDYEFGPYNAVDGIFPLLVRVYYLARASFYIIQINFGTFPVNGDAYVKRVFDRCAAVAYGVHVDIVGSLVEFTHIRPVSGFCRVKRIIRQFVKLIRFIVIVWVI